MRLEEQKAEFDAESLSGSAVTNIPVKMDDIHMTLMQAILRPYVEWLVIES